MESIYQESHWISLGKEDRLHLRRIWTRKPGVGVLMLHGAIENGRIFYSETGKGFGPFLASRGYDVFVADLRGRGQSTPPISSRAQYGQTDSIVEEIPALIRGIVSLHGKVPSIWVGHSWGGVLLLSAFARIPSLQEGVEAMVFFGTKRSVRVQNFQKWMKVDLFWKTLSRWIVRRYGFLPAKEWGIGSDNETHGSLRQSIAWVRPSAWIDPQDGFDYGKAIQKIRVPPCLFLAGSQDACLGNPQDVQRWIDEVQSPRSELMLLPGFGHIDMMTSSKAPSSHFTRVVEWLSKHGLSPAQSGRVEEE